MPVETIRYRQPTQSDTGNGYSDTIWADCPLEGLRDGSVRGYLWEYDFDGFKLASNVNAAEAYWSNGLNVFGSDGAAVAALAAQGGGVTIGSDGDNEGASIRQTMPVVKIARATGKFWFEARLKASTITDTKNGFFVGLMDSTAVSATVPIAAAGTLADVNLVGFHRLEGDGDALDFVYKADGVTQVTVLADAATLVADTYFKVGMTFDPGTDAFNTGAVGDGYGKYLLNGYFDGARLSTPKQIPAADGTDFPNDVLLGFVFAVLNATASTPGTNTIDRVRIAQLY